MELRLLKDEVYLDELDAIEDELMDEYVQNSLTPEERKQFEKRLQLGNQQQEKAAFAHALSEAATERATRRAKVVEFAPPARKQSAFSSSYLRIAAGLILAVGAGLAAWFWIGRETDVDRGMLALNQAYRNERLVQSRISELNYAPARELRGIEQSAIDRAARDYSERLLLDAVNQKGDAAAYHALGRLYLAERQFDKAIVQFEKALTTDALNALLLSDFGAALFEKAKVDRAGSDAAKAQEEFARSLEMLNRALDLDGSLLEALFNRALLHHEMGLPRQAADDWRSYLQRDSSSKWAVEAQQNLKLLEERGQRSRPTKEELLEGFLQAHASQDDEKAWDLLSNSREALSQKLIWNQILDRYLNARMQGQADEANRQMQALTFAGDLDERKAGDRFVLDLARFYRSVSPSNLQSLAEARSSIKQGHDHYLADRRKDAEESYTKAEKVFTSLSNRAEAKYVQHLIAFAKIERGEREKGIAILEGLAPTLRDEKYPWLLMRALHLAASGYHNLNQYSQAINRNREALALAQRINDKVGIFNTANILTFQYSTNGNHAEAFTYMDLAQPVGMTSPLNDLQIARSYTIPALAFDRARLYHAAIAYQKEAIEHTKAIGHIQHTALNYANLGEMFGKLKKFDEAFKNLALSVTTAESHPEEGRRKQMMAYSALRTGHLHREQGDLNKAIKSYDQTIALSEHIGFQYSVFEARKNRLYCYLHTGNDNLVQGELQTTLELAEKYRAQIREGNNRNSFFDIEHSIYDLAIEFSYSRIKDSQSAFQYSEESRSRSLLDSVVGNSAVDKELRDLTFASVERPLTLSEIQTRMPEDAQILQYAVLNQKLLGWIVSRSGFETFEVNVPQQDLQREVSSFLDLISGRSVDSQPEMDQAAKTVFKFLIGPAERFLDKNKPVYIVPDKFLNAVPFAALVSPATNRKVVEDYLLETSPSASLLVILTELARAKEGTHDERVLSVGNPRFARKSFSDLPDLPAAAREAEVIAGFYRSPKVLTGKYATTGQVKETMGNFDVVHLALHSVVNPRSPINSRLLFAEDSAADGSLQAEEIYRMKMPKTRLAVLSACQTGAERYYAGEGMISLARPFLVAGVPLVLVSLWPVDSAATAELMISFHRHRTQGKLPSAAALKRAQLDMLARSEEQLRSPFNWGAFVLIGGSARF